MEKKRYKHIIIDQEGLDMIMKVLENSLQDERMKAIMLEHITLDELHAVKRAFEIAKKQNGKEKR